VENTRTDSDVDTAFASFSQQHVGAVLVNDSAFFGRRTEQLAALAARHALPAISALKGDKPADLPVQQVTKLDLLINLKTAKTLGLTIPETLLATADEVIQ
jgi:putative ABC transport system substrate-binding protein